MCSFFLAGIYMYCVCASFRVLLRCSIGTVCDFIGNTPVSSSADGISSTWLSSLSNSFRAVCSLSAPLPTSYSHTICSFVFHTSRAVFSSSRRIPPPKPLYKTICISSLSIPSHRTPFKACPMSSFFALLCARLTLLCFALLSLLVH